MSTFNNKQLVISCDESIKAFNNNYLNNKIISGDTSLRSCSGHFKLKLKDVDINSVNNITINNYDDCIQIFLTDPKCYNQMYKQVDPLSFVVRKNTDKLFNILDTNYFN